MGAFSLVKPLLLAAVFSSLVAVSHQSASEIPLFLNSGSHCGNVFSVSQTTVYNVRDQSLPRSVSAAFQGCQLVFRTSPHGGRLCVMQRQLRFDACHMQLELYDGMSVTDGVRPQPNKTADCDKVFGGAEWCTNSDLMTVGVKQAGSNPRLEHIHVNLLVYDIRSRHRTVYMDSLPYCGSHFELDNSQVIVSNLDPQRESAKKPFPVCTLTFGYQAPDDNKTVCAELLAGSDSKCDLPYDLTMYGSERQSPHTVDVCTLPPSRWCWATHTLTLELRRKKGETTKEANGLFSLSVCDQCKDDKTSAESREKDDNSHQYSSAHVTIIATAAAVCGIIVGVVIVPLVAYIRNKLARGNYQIPPSPEQLEQQDHDALNQQDHAPPPAPEHGEEQNSTALHPPDSGPSPLPEQLERQTYLAPLPPDSGPPPPLRQLEGQLNLQNHAPPPPPRQRQGHNYLAFHPSR